MRHTASAEIGAEIRAHLGRQGKSATWLAETVDIDASGMSRRLRGERSITADEMTRIAAALGVPFSALLPAEKAS